MQRVKGLGTFVLVLRVGGTYARDYSPEEWDELTTGWGVQFLVSAAGKSDAAVDRLAF